jgi:hypothetical protein
MVSILDAIVAINSNARAVVEGTDIDDCTIKWMDGTAEISKADIKTKIAELKTSYDNNKYQRDRAAEYPSIADQLDKIYHDGVDEWKKVIKKVKDDNPKS